MPTYSRARWIAALLAVAALLALPAAAQATLAYTKNPLQPVVYVANDDGSGAHRVGKGSDPRVSPDGQSVVYLAEGPGNKQEMKLVPASGGPARTLMVGWREDPIFDFSPDSTQLAALRGGELGKRKLVLVDLASGAQKVVASGFFGGVSFSPSGTELAYSRANSDKYPPRSDVYKVPVAAGKPVALTKDHNSQAPVWGPNGEIVFVKLLDANKRKYGPKSELYLMNEAGKAVERLTHTKVAALLTGLFPTEWSADGSRLLAEFEGQDTSYAVAVNPKTGAQKAIAGAGEMAFVGTALSADGRTVLGFTGGFEPGPNHAVATVPYAGGKPKVLVKGAYMPAWSR